MQHCTYVLLNYSVYFLWTVSLPKIDRRGNYGSLCPYVSVCVFMCEYWVHSVSSWTQKQSGDLQKHLTVQQSGLQLTTVMTKQSSNPQFTLKRERRCICAGFHEDLYCVCFHLYSHFFEFRTNKQCVLSRRSYTSLLKSYVSAVLGRVIRDLR